MSNEVNPNRQKRVGWSNFNVVINQGPGSNSGPYHSEHLPISGITPSPGYSQGVTWTRNEAYFQHPFQNFVTPYSSNPSRGFFSSSPNIDCTYFPHYPFRQPMENTATIPPSPFHRGTMELESSPIHSSIGTYSHIMRSPVECSDDLVIRKKARKEKPIVQARKSKRGPVPSRKILASIDTGTFGHAFQFI